MATPHSTARIAGLIYLVLVVFGIINLMYIPSKLIVWEDAVQTYTNIANNEWLFRLGIVSGIIAFLAFLMLPLALYKLLHGVHEGHARLMVAFALVSIPLSIANMLHKFSVLSLVGDTDYAQAMGKAAAAAQVMLHLDYYNNGVEISQIFWGLWLFPFGYLVYQSGFLPKALGILLMAGCFGYLVTFFVGFLYAGFRQAVISDIVGLPASIGEVGICLWLLAMGARKPNWPKAKGHGLAQ